MCLLYTKDKHSREDDLEAVEPVYSLKAATEFVEAVHCSNSESLDLTLLSGTRREGSIFLRSVALCKTAGSLEIETQVHMLSSPTKARNISR